MGAGWMRLCTGHEGWSEYPVSLSLLFLRFMLVGLGDHDIVTMHAWPANCKMRGLVLLKHLEDLTLL